MSKLYDFLIEGILDEKGSIEESVKVIERGCTIDTEKDYAAAERNLFGEYSRDTLEMSVIKHAIETDEDIARNIRDNNLDPATVANDAYDRWVSVRNDDLHYAACRVIDEVIEFNNDDEDEDEYEEEEDNYDDEEEEAYDDDAESEYDDAEYDDE